MLVAGGRRTPTWLLGLLTALLAVLPVGCAGAAPSAATSPSAWVSSPTVGASAPGAGASSLGASSPRAGVGGSAVDGSGGGEQCPAPSPNTPGARESRLPLRSLCALPPEAAQLWRTIQTGGRLTYLRDGTVFNNAEHILPRRERGYYHEYTVPTPGSRDRGARRLVTGQGHELYYTGDHYASFVVVDPTAMGSG